MEARKPVITPTETKEYLIKNGIPQLFECLMTGLMYHRPTDHINYLQECLEKIKKDGIAGVRWDMFLETRQDTPPVAAPKKAADDTSQYDPLPGIDSLRVNIRPNASVICVLAGPGANKSTYSQGLVNHYPTFVHLSMGDLLRNRAKLESERKDSKWADCVERINAGELLPHEMVVETLVWNLNRHADASGFIIDGYPRTAQQYEELKAQVSLERLACIFLIDAAEEFCRQQLSERSRLDDFWKDNDEPAIENRICLFKLQTLPLCKCIDNDGKLRVVDGEIKPEHIARDMRTVCEYVLSGKVTGPTTRPTPGTLPDRPLQKASHGMSGCQGQPPVFNIPRIIPTFADKGRVSDLPVCPVIMIFGGPGSGRTEQAQALCAKLAGLKHFNVTEFLRNRVLNFIEENSEKDWDVVARRVHSSDPPTNRDRVIPEYWDVQVDIIRQEFNDVAKDTRAVVIEGFPNDENQLNTFNQHIGGADLAVLLDCEEATLQKRLQKRYSRLGRIEDDEPVALQRILFFKHCTLPVIRHYDERSILVTIPGDREQELVLNDVVTVVEYFLGKQESQANNSAAATLSEAVNEDNEYCIKESVDEMVEEKGCGHEEAKPTGTEPTPKVMTEIEPVENFSETHKPEELQEASEGSKDAEHAGPILVFFIGKMGSKLTSEAQKIAKEFEFQYISMSALQNDDNACSDDAVRSADGETVTQESPAAVLEGAVAKLAGGAKCVVIDDYPSTSEGGLVDENQLPPNRIVLLLSNTHSEDDGQMQLQQGKGEGSEGGGNIYKVNASRPDEVVFDEICSILKKAIENFVPFRPL
ncbi:unnamed protein product [Calicophoron daubneyi]|uniref:Adenylate kinase isoenzyme 5 n=1 Tax=Calicophoron daubneyi TaxID=300641 RepID=A0AAV2TRN3_CALDB